MTTHQPGRPKPPPPNTSWLDYVTDPSQLPMANEIPYAREELADLRGHLKLQTENVLALMQERDELRKVVDAATRYCDAWQAIEDYKCAARARASQLWEAYMTADGAVFDAVARHRAAAKKEGT